MNLGRSIRQNKALVALLAAGLALSSAALAIAPEFKLGIGENVRKLDPPGGGTYLPLTTSLANRGVSTDFVTHWFHGGWKNAFPDTGVAYLAGYCNSGSEFNSLADYQAILSAGKRLVLVWWWHNDLPCDTSLRTDAENTLRDCLVPMISALNNGEVYVVLQPEYNRYDSCNAYQDATWSTHLNTMMAQIHGISKAGLTVKVGPAVGDWAYDRSAYQVEGSLNGCIANADFIAHHEIYRQNSDHPAPNDTNYGNPSTDSIEHAMSYARYLKKRFGKPILWAYESVNSSNYTQAGQSNALLDVFKYRATLMARDVKMFGNFWLFPDPSYPGESLIDSSNVQRTAFATWKNEANAVIANTDRTHSIGFISPDQGDALSGTISVQWISRGRPQTASTFNLDVSLNGGAFSSVATGLAGDDSSTMTYNWDTCALGPVPDVRLRLTCPATGATITSGRFAIKNLSATSNSLENFEASAAGWQVVGSGGGGSALSVTQVNGQTAFHGTGSLKVVCDFNAGQNAYIETNAPAMTMSGGQRVTALIYIPFDLNPCTIPGAEVSRVKIDLKDSAFLYIQSPQYLLQEGWNRVIWDMGAGSAGAVNYMKMSFYNKWGYTGNPAIYIDEIRVGTDLVYTGVSCGTPSSTATPTYTRTVTASRTPSPSPTATYSVTVVLTNTDTTTRTSTATPSGTPTATPTRTASGSPSASASVSPTFTMTSTRTSTATATTTSTPSSTRTVTGSPSASPSVSASPSASSSATPSQTRTVSPSATSTRTVTAPLTATDTPTVTPTPTETLYLGSATSTHTATATATGTPVLSATSTSSASPSATPSSTATETLFLTPTSTGTVTPSSTETTFFTATDTPTVSPTGTFTETPQDSPTATGTVTPGPSDTVSPTSTSSASPSASPTQTVVLPSATPTFTRTQTPVLPSATFTFTRTMTPTFTATQSSTPGAVAGTNTPGTVPGSIISTLPAVNPHFGGPLQIAINSSGRVEKVQFRLYTSGYIFLTQIEQVGPWGSGWNTVTFPVPVLPNGAYFYTIRGFSNVGPAGMARRAKLVVLR